MKINIFLLVVFTCLEPPVVQHLQPYLCSPDPTLIVQNNHFLASTNPWVPLPVSVFPHLLEWRPVGFRRLDRLLQLLIRQDLDQMTKTMTDNQEPQLRSRPRPAAPSSGLRSSSASWPGFPRLGNSSWRWRAWQGCLFVGQRRSYFQLGWKYTVDFSQMMIIST